MDTIKHRLKTNGITIGSWITSGSPAIAEIMAHSGFDYLCVDVEHSGVDLQTTEHLFRAIRASNPDCEPFVRLHGVDYAFVKRYLDAGARGVVAPLVKTKNEVEELINAVKYPPLGQRGVGFCRANQYGFRLEDEFSNANDNTTVILQIEHIEAVQNIDSMLSVPGVDAVFIGPYDLTASMGITAQFDNKEFLQAKNKVLAACKKHGIAAGVHIVQPDVKALEQAINEGYRFLAYSLDITILTHHLKQAVPEIKHLLDNYREN